MGVGVRGGWRRGEGVGCFEVMVGWGVEVGRGEEGGGVLWDRVRRRGRGAYGALSTDIS